jgi:hypothetical protein
MIDIDLVEDFGLYRPLLLIEFLPGRFQGVYARAAREYLTVTRQDGLNSFWVDRGRGRLDAWDIVKVLGLLRKSDTQVFELLAHPAIHESPDFALVREVAPRYFDARTVGYTYHSAALATMNTEADVKRAATYLLRADYVATFQEQAPLELATKSELAQAFADSDLDVLHTFINRSIPVIAERLRALPRSIPGDAEALDEVFRKVVMG